MTETEQIANRIRRVLSHVKGGAIRVWGQWLGRPNDAMHIVAGCEATGTGIRIFFNEGEVLSVWSPQHAIVDKETFRIEDAQRVRWEWFYYGRPKTPENLYHFGFERKGDVIEVSTNVDWYASSLDPDSSRPAVEIL